MFFYIGSECPIKALTQVEPNLFLDHGWKCKDDIWYKGYSTEVNLDDAVIDIVQGYRPAGKWAVVSKNNLYHPEFRGFPLFIKDENITNINLEGYEPVTYEYLISPITGKLSLDEASNIIQNILSENTINFLKYNQIPKMNILFSGGLDTLTSWAVYNSISTDYNLHIYLPKASDREDLPSKMGTIREYQSDLIDTVNSNWGYSISSIFKDTNWYLTGFYAEVLTYRDAEAINAIANYHKKHIDELADPSDYLYWFLKRPTLAKYKNVKILFGNEKIFKDYLWSTIFYDHQMWHIDNNMTFSPFFDIRIPLVMNQLSIEDIKENALTGCIQKNIVRNLNPSLLKLLSSYKNEKNVWTNFNKFWPRVKLDPNIKVNIR